MSKVRIESIDSVRARVFLNDVDISEYVSTVTFTKKAGKVADIGLGLVAGKVDVESLSAFVSLVEELNDPEDGQG